MTAHLTEETLPKPLRTGFTTGACATAAARAAYISLATGTSPESVVITLPRGQTVEFTITDYRQGVQVDGTPWYGAAVVKDAGDDPDVTHGATIWVRLWSGAPESGIQFRAGAGVGTVTRAGLSLKVGEAAINPVPRQMIIATLLDAAAAAGAAGTAGAAGATSLDLVVEISIPNGAEIARHTLNERLGIVGGLSILGTTGIVIPYSCSAWIHSIHRGIDVALAAGATTLVAATGRTSELAAQQRLAIADHALIDMGDFVGGMLKYLRQIEKQQGRLEVTLVIVGGLGKLAKFASGELDLHSGRSRSDIAQLLQWANPEPVPISQNHPEKPPTTTVAELWQELTQTAPAAAQTLVDEITRRAKAVALKTLGDGTAITVQIHIYDRQGILLGES